MNLSILLSIIIDSQKLFWKLWINHSHKKGRKQLKPFESLHAYMIDSSFLFSIEFTIKNDSLFILINLYVKLK